MRKSTIALIVIERNVFTGKVCLTFFGQWSEVQSEISSKAMEQMYCAPGTIILHCQITLVVS